MPLVAIVVAGDSAAADGASWPFGWRAGRHCKSCGCVAGTGGGSNSRGLEHDQRRRRDNVSASTGKRAGPREKRHDRRPRRGSSSYRWGRSHRLVRPTVRGRSSCLHAGVHTGAG